MAKHNLEVDKTIFLNDDFTVYDNGQMIRSGSLNKAIINNKEYNVNFNWVYGILPHHTHEPLFSELTYTCTLTKAARKIVTEFIQDNFHQRNLTGKELEEIIQTRIEDKKQYLQTRMEYELSNFETQIRSLKA